MLDIKRYKWQNLVEVKSSHVMMPPSVGPGVVSPGAVGPGVVTPPSVGPGVL